MKRTLYLSLALIFICVTFLHSQNNLAVLLHTGTTSFPENVKSYPAAATIGAGEMIEGFYYRILQFHELPDAATFKALGQNGITLLEYIPHNTYVAAIPTSFDMTRLESMGVRSIQNITPALKQSAALKNGNLPAWAIEKNQALLMLKFYKNLEHEKILRYCEADGIQVLRSNGYNNFLRISVPIEKIEQVASLPYVAFLELVPPPDVPDDILGRSLHRSNLIDAQFPSGRHYTGEGVNVLVRDDGVVGPHIDFQGRIDNSFTDPQTGSHGDGVAGIIGGAGNLDPWNRGMAAGSFVYVVNYVSDFLDETMDLFFNKDVMVTNSSYSNGCNAGYTEITETVDQQLYNNPTLMHVFSAGNSNGQNCGYGAGNQWGNITGGHKQAKNCIATANLIADATLTASSSRGPAHDGRLKPDIAAHGTDQVSTDENNTYQVFGGTSAASPGIAGIMAQLHQAHRELNNGQTADAALLKTILLNTANDLGNVGPDYKFGWGHVNAYRAVLTLEDGRHMTGTVEPGQTNTHNFTIPAGVLQARFMVYWMDQEGTVMTTKALVNDLDITMTGPGGDTYMPWLLDPTPVVAALDKPAGNGVDTLNNMEQVSIANPAEGEYVLNVEGKELPFGAHSYYVAWEYRTAEITVTHPVGGESFAPGEKVRIHWDTEGNTGFFVIYYSIDNGANWIAITSGTGDQRMTDWTVPNQLTSKAKIRITRSGQEDTSDEVFSIAPRPKNLTVEKACPDFIRVKWDAVVLDSQGVTSYQVMMLGDKYMEPVDTVTDTFYEFPTIDMNPTNDHWFTVRAMAAGGIISERPIAINHKAGLLNCAQEHDMSMVSINSPGSGSVFGCGSFDVTVSITVKNIGLMPESNISVAYEFENEPPVVESIPGPVAEGASVTFTFATKINATVSGDYSLKAYTDLAGDLVTFNNSATQSMSVSIYPGSGEPLEYTEDFQGGFFPPPFYLINNPDAGLTWVSRKVIGPTGDSTVCMWVNNFSYNANGQEDDMLVVPIDLTNATAPQLSFDLAYARYNGTFQDRLKVSISTDCGATFSNEIYNKFGTQLATAPDVTNSFSPKANQWRNEQISLANYVGNSVVLKFTNVNGYGNGMHVDNINIKEVSPPTAGFTASIAEICQGQTVVFTSNSMGEGISHAWSFGAGASPATSTSEGPVTVTFNQPGTFTPTLTVTNAAGQSTADAEVIVKAKPVSNFSFAANSGTITFTNTSQFGATYLWNFGDGGLAFTEEAEHTYDTSGVYTVTLTVTNDCGTAIFMQNVNVMLTSTNALEQRISATVSPNPNPGVFTLLLKGDRTELLSVELMDVRGVVHEKRSFLTTGHITSQRFEATHLPPGIYFLKVRSNDGFMALKVLVE